MTTYGYIRVSGPDQARSGLGIDAQRRRIADAWDVDEWVEDRARSAKSTARPGLQRMLAEVDAGDVIVVSNLDRLSRSTVDFGRMLDRALKEGWSIASLHPPIDLTTTDGRMFARLLVTFAEWERERMGDRMRDVHAERQARGEPWAQRDPRTVAYVRRMQSTGWSLGRIADRLNDRGVATPSGRGRWWPATVARVGGGGHGLA